MNVLPRFAVYKYLNEFSVYLKIQFSRLYPLLLIHGNSDGVRALIALKASQIDSNKQPNLRKLP